ncbi:MAG: SdrD B-like domain-containing protein [archaeon]
MRFFYLKDMRLVHWRHVFNGCAGNVSRLLVSLAILFALSGSSFAQTTISLGTANQYAIMGRYIHLHNCTVTGNAAIGNGAVCSPAPAFNLRFESPGILNGTAYTQTGAIVDGQTSNASGGIVVNDPMVTQAFADAMVAYNNAIALTPDQTIASVNSPTTINATHSGQYVIHITGNIQSQLILNPYPSGITKFIVIVDGTITLGGSDIVGASSSAGSKNVLIVVKGTGTQLTSHIDNFIYGTVLAPYRGAEFHGFAGAMLAGCEYVKYQSGAQITFIPYEPLQPPTNCLGLAARYGVLGLDNGTVIINSATNLIAWVGYSDGVTSTTNQKVDNFIGKVEVHTGATFNYTPATFNPSLGIYTTGYDDSLDIANSDALYASNNFAAMTPDVTYGSVTSSMTINRTDNVTVVQMGSLNYNSQTLTLAGQAGQDDAFVINVLGNFTFADSKIQLVNVRPERVVFNFPNASSIDLYKATNVFYGTILAPTGSVIYHNPATFEGAIIAKNINLHSDFNLTQKSLDIPCETPSTASLGDFIWNDLNHNGIQEVGEPGIPNVTVELHRCSDNSLVATQVTNASGYYLFSNLPAGGYYIKVTAPAGYSITIQNAGLNDALDSDIDPTSGVTGCYTLAAGQINLTADGGLYQPSVLLGSIGDFVWNDLNHNGIQDTGEPGIPGVPVELHDGTGAVIKTTITDANGYYTFTSLPAGQYYVSFTPPAGYTISPINQGGDDTKDSDIDPLTGQTVTFALAAGENNPTIDAGMYLPQQTASLGDFVWNDVNHNGIQDAGELGIQGVTVELRLCSDYSLVTTDITDANGNYLFTGLTPNVQYFIKVIPPAGYPFISPINQGGDDTKDSDIGQDGQSGCITLAPGENNLTVDAGLYAPTPNPASIGDFVWKDLNNNGIQDSGEPGIPGVTVNLYACNSNTILQTTTTDASGLYHFTGLTPGSYYVQFVLPTGYAYSPMNAGSDDALDSDADPANAGKTGCYTLIAGETNNTVDAGLYPIPPAKASLGDFVWLDSNMNGIQDAGELGIPNVTVELHRCSDQSLVATTTTSPGGIYSFTNLDPGSYYIKVIKPLNYTISPINQGLDDTKDSDIGNDGQSACITLAAGENNLTLDAGMYPTPPQTASIGDFVWNDVNHNGIQDAGEPGIPNVTVYLYACNTNNVLQTTTTAPDGSYHFTGLNPGSYYVQFVLPSGYTFTTLNAGLNDASDSDADPANAGKTACYDLSAGENETTADAGMYPTPPNTASLGDFVWNDVNQNGIQDAGEMGIPNVTVELHRCSDNSLVATTTTNPSGIYSFTNLVPGGYYIKVIPPANFAISPINQGGDDTKDSDIGQDGMSACVTLNAGDNNLTLDAGLYPSTPAPASIGDRVWNDINHNGIQDAGEPGIQGVIVNLFACNGNVVLQSTTTASDGSYHFTGLTPGSYYVQFVLPSGYTFSPMNAGSDDALDSDADAANFGKTACYDLSAGENETTADAGMYPTPQALASLGDFIWLDTNHNGIQEAGEIGLPNVTVELHRCSDQSLVATTTTSPGGIYSFTNLAPDGYYIKVIVPAGYSISPINQGTDDTKDSDIGNDGQSACITLAAGDNNLTVDAGLYPAPPSPASIGDFVWNDTNHNGIQDSNEPGIPNVTVELYRCADNSFVATTTTDANGAYHFTGLTPGDYYVKFILPSGYTFSPMNAGADNVDSDADASLSGRTACYNLSAGENETTADAGMYPTPQQVGSLGDFVWNDLNHNGIQDANEPGIPNVQVQLHNGTGAVIATTTTDASGHYVFTNLQPGQYYVHFTPPAGYTITLINQGMDDTKDSDIGNDGNTNWITLAPGENNMTVDAGMYTTPPQTACIGDFVWNDANHNGIQDANETGIPGISIELHKCSDNSLVATTVSVGNGFYSFCDVPEGSYYVKFVTTGWVVSPANQGGDDNKDSDIGADGKTACFNVVPGQNNYTVDAGLYPPTPGGNGCVGDFVWNDLNHNGIQDVNEPGIPGVTVELHDCATHALVATAVTNMFGHYQFYNVPAGSYYIKVLAPAGFNVSPANQGSNDEKDSDIGGDGQSACFNVVAGIANNSIDAGLYTTPQNLACIGDFVWLDLNHNGIQDQGEPGLYGIMVVLYRCSDNSPVAWTTTNYFGQYAFPNIPAGNYYVKFTVPAGYTVSPALQGGNPALDSNPDATGKTACFTVAGGTSNVTIDAGMYPTPSDKGSIGDFVWRDINGNGIQDANEPGLPGITVELHKCSDYSLFATTTTDATGHYAFTNVPAGSYFVKILIPSGYTVSPIHQGSNDALDSDFGSDGQTACFNVVGGVTDNTIDAGLVPPVTTDLEVLKSASKLFLQCGENFTYTVTVKNLGPVAANAVVVTDVEPLGADFASATASQGTYNMATGVWQVGNLAVGATATLTLNALVDCTELSSSSLSLGPVSGYNLFVFNDLNQSASNAQGKVAVGGNATMTGYSSIGGSLAPNSGNVLVVGGNLTMINGIVANGNVVYGGTTNLPQPAVLIPGGTLIHATPVDFAAAQSSMNSLSAALAGYGANGTTVFQWGGLTLSGSDPQLNVFNVSGSDLSAANNFVINVPNGSVVVVNISGQNVTWGGGMTVNGAAANNVIYNFYQALTLKIQGIDLKGTVLAPLAALDFPSGIVSGQAIVKSLTGAGQFCNVPFTGTIPASKSFTNTAMLTGSSPVDVTVANNSSSVTVTVGTQPGNGGQPPICQLDGMICAFAFDGCNMYAATSCGKVYRSTDGGQTWQPFSEGLNAAYIWALSVVNGTVFAATEQGIYAFNGTRWVLIGCGNYDVHDLVGCNGILYAATWSHGVQMSTDMGLNWIPVNSGFTTLPYIQALTASADGYIYAATLGSGIYRLPCGGTTWTQVGAPGQSFWTIAGCQNYLYAASYGDGLYQSCDGTTWNKITTLPCPYIYSIDISPCGKVFVSSLMGGVYCSGDNGATWTNLGFGGGNVCAVIVDPATEDVYVGTKAGEVYKLNKNLTGVEDRQKAPTEFSLSQNYPNPFNPSTTISFAVPAAGRYTLKVYNMLGQEVATLINGELSIGYHKAVFDAGRISSGMYIYRLTGEKVNMVKKMLLVK